MNLEMLIAAGPWGLVVVAFFWAWTREQRMVKGLDHLQDKCEALEREYREDLKMLLRESQQQTSKCLDALNLAARQAHESARILARVKCVRPLDECVLEAAREKPLP